MKFWVVSEMYVAGNSLGYWRVEGHGSGNRPVLNFLLSLIICSQQFDFVLFSATMKDCAAIPNVTCTVTVPLHNETYVWLGMIAQAHGAEIADHEAAHSTSDNHIVLSGVIRFVDGRCTGGNGQGCKQQKHQEFHGRRIAGCGVY
jgi:hypothetical protein